VCCRLRGGKWEAIDDLGVFGDYNMTLPSYDEIANEIKDYYLRKAQGKLRPDEMDDCEEERIPDEGKLMLCNIPQGVDDSMVEGELRRFGNIRDFHSDKHARNGILTGNGYFVIAKYPNYTEAERAREKTKQLTWVRDNSISVVLARSPRDKEMDDYRAAGGWDSSEHVYDAYFRRDTGNNPLVSEGMRTIWKKPRKRREASREQKERRAKGHVHMDHLADFEQDKLKKLIRQFPDVAFPDNWCEDDNGWTLYVGRVPLDVTGSELEGVFEKFGRLSNLRIGKSWENAPKQFGFVSYKTAEGASRAISEIGSDTFRLREDQAPLDIKFAQRYMRRRRYTGSYQENGDNEVEEIMAEKRKRAEASLRAQARKRTEEIAREKRFRAALHGV